MSTSRISKVAALTLALAAPVIASSQAGAPHAAVSAAAGATAGAGLYDMSRQ
ncbi:hypothetical protein [Streptomyces jumonjinensis]|uniref:hypothetical protein n=1 Tax=Streptomyces jumonjinensis TaxID=1945 RepID=UPI003799AD8F